MSVTTVGQMPPLDTKMMFRLGGKDKLEDFTLSNLISKPEHLEKRIQVCIEENRIPSHLQVSPTNGRLRFHKIWSVYSLGRWWATGPLRKIRKFKRKSIRTFRLI